jgi:DNA (cytosine-5)-methyltransferase 1
MAYNNLPADLKANWIWWNLPAPPSRTTALADLLEPPGSVDWHSAEHTQRLLSLMSPLHLDRVNAIRALGRPVYGTVYRRTRRSPSSTVALQRAEVRFDGLAGCLRTPAGGSSRQTILLIDGPQTRSRLLNPREAARLMGLPDSYLLPKRPTDAYHLTGDGLAVPAVNFLARHLLDWLVQAPRTDGAKGRKAVV